MSLKSWLIAILGLCILAPSTLAAIATAPAIRDAYVESGFNADTNYGNMLQLRTGVYTAPVQRSYLMFNISGLAGLSISRVELRLQSIGGSGSGRIAAHLVEANWGELQITWNNAPPFRPEPISFHSIKEGGVYSFDVTAPVLSALSSGKQMISFMLKMENEELSNNYRIFYSRESPSLRPVLEALYAANAPVITSVSAPTEVSEGQSVTLSFSATDADNNLDSAGIYIDGKLLNAGYSATWTPDYESAGSHEVLFRVNDTTGLVTTESRVINVRNAASLVINELLPNPTSPNQGWIELYNPLNTAFNVGGCQILTSGGYVIPLTGNVPSKAYGMITNLGVLGVSGDKLRLICNGLLIDRVAYGNHNDGNLADNAPAPAAGLSIGRRMDGLDTDTDNADFRVFSNPTPNATNSVAGIHDADTNRDGCISMSELLAYISLWKADPIGVGMNNLLSAIALWKAKPIC